MQEIRPGLFHWTAIHPRIQIAVSSYYWRDARVLIDPLLPGGGLDELRSLGAPQDIVLTNRHHWRHTGEIRAAFDCAVWCNREGLHEFGDDRTVRGFTAGDELPGGIHSYEIGALCPDETALWLGVEGGALAVADGVVRDADGPLSFVPDFLIAESPEDVARVKLGLRAAYARVIDEAPPFDALLCAHGLPWLGGASEALQAFAAD